MHFKIISLVLIFQCFSFCICQQAPDVWSLEEVEELKSKIKEFYENNMEDNLQAAALRLAFHDCVGRNGCDGCINIDTDPANNGLEGVIEQFKGLYPNTTQKEIGKYMSRADFYNLAAISTVEMGIMIHNRECLKVPAWGACLLPQADIKFVMGRQDCPTSPDTADIDMLPDAFLNNTELTNFWKDEFNFTSRDTVAILGGHTLGAMDGTASGYTGHWKEGLNEEFKFNNEYYRLLFNPDLTWKHVDVAMTNSTKVADQRFMWKGVESNNLPKSSMLDVDVSLVLDLDIVDAGGRSTCDFKDEEPENQAPRCPDSPTRETAKEYAMDGRVWLKDFVCAFEKMTTAGLKNATHPLSQDQTEGRKKGYVVSCN